MLKLAVIGKDVSQSCSPDMHKFILTRLGETCSYDTVSVPPAEFSSRAEKLLRSYDALNVTIPFKGEMLAYLKELRGDARLFGAVNLVKCRERTGYNTDGYGFLLMLRNAGIEVKDKSVLVLGAGGAGRSCIKKLLEAGAAVSVYEQSRERLFEAYSEFGSFTPLTEVPFLSYDIALNCTGVGMHNTVGKTPNVTYAGGNIAPVGKELLSLCDTAVDLIYVPEQSEFLKVAKSAGCKTLNGADMLFYQAYMADCILLDMEPDADEARAFRNAYRESTR